MKKLIAMLLCCLLIGSLAACETVDYVAQVEGTWICAVEQPKQKLELMKNMELFEEEVALVEAKLFTAKTVTFNSDKTYYFAEDPDRVKAHLRNFYSDLFDDLYEGRATLAECYDTDISQLSKEEFYQFYAELYGAESYEALIPQLAENTYDYDTFGKIEEGTYGIGSKGITVDTEGTEDDGTIKYTLEDGVLTLVYSDSTEVYTRHK
jgi:hypothetical protein